MRKNILLPNKLEKKHNAELKKQVEYKTLKELPCPLCYCGVVGIWIVLVIPRAQALVSMP